MSTDSDESDQYDSSLFDGSQHYMEALSDLIVLHFLIIHTSLFVPGEENLYTKYGQTTKLNIFVLNISQNLFLMFWF